MVKEIVRDPAFLALPSEPASEEDLQTGQDLLDTLAAHRDRCVGMAANMIGVRKRIIVFDDGGKPALMFNPEIVRKGKPYETEEGCLSLEGRRRCRRWDSVKVKYQNAALQTRYKTYTGWTAEIIQHELDHCDGILI